MTQKSGRHRAGKKKAWEEKKMRHCCRSLKVTIGVGGKWGRWLGAGESVELEPNC